MQESQHVLPVNRKLISKDSLKKSRRRQKEKKLRNGYLKSKGISTTTSFKQPQLPLSARTQKSPESRNPHQKQIDALKEQLDNLYHNNTQIQYLVCEIVRKIGEQRTII